MYVFISFFLRSKQVIQILDTNNLYSILIIADKTTQFLIMERLMLLQFCLGIHSTDV